MAPKPKPKVIKIVKKTVLKPKVIKIVKKIVPKPKVIKIVHKPVQKKAETCKAPKSHKSPQLKKDKGISKASLLHKIENMRKELTVLAKAKDKKKIKGECAARNHVSKQKPAHQSRAAL